MAGVAAEVTPPEVSQHIVILAASCAACHGTNGNSVGGTPVLAGLDASYFAAQMHAFQTNQRASTVMHHLSQGLTPVEIQQMGIFFANQPRLSAHMPPSPTAVSPAAESQE
ncbi:MAG TPA: c-type cytochrome [Methylophilaceae bacterium]|nr:c-type cytochrome [Methylophilaceae bacterium]